MEGLPGNVQMLDGSGHTPRDARIVALCWRQHGVIALAQLVALGLSASAVRSRVASGRLQRVHRGVFATCDPRALSPKGRFAAAVLACSAGSVVSHRSAAALFELRLRTTAWVDVTTPGSTARRRAGIHIHSGATLTPSDVTLIDDIPATTLARTLLDVAQDATRREVERACDEAELRRLLNMRAIDDVLARATGRRGARLLADVLATHRVGSTLTRNALEERFLAICRDIERAPDAVNQWIAYPQGGGAEADFVWRAERLIVEVDGRDPHSTRRAFEHDRRRDQQLALRGYRVIRFTWRQVTHDPAYVAATLTTLL
jgi:predicted transcriptional regulator of viral defense system